MSTDVNENPHAVNELKEDMYYTLCYHCGQIIEFPIELMYKYGDCPNCGFHAYLRNDKRGLFKMNCPKCRKETWAYHLGLFQCVHCGLNRGKIEGHTAIDPTRTYPPTPWKDYILTFLGLAAVIALAIFALPFIVLIIYMFIFLFFMGGARLK